MKRYINPYNIMILAQNLSKSYNQSLFALNNVSFEIPAQSFTALVGRSGSGKSTLLHLLAAMDKPSEGTLTVDGKSVGGLDVKAQAKYRRESVGMIFQSFNLVQSMTALQNVELPLILSGMPEAERLKIAEERLNSVGLAHRLHHKPTELSGGEQQRVAIARALVHNPPILLADEPTGNLDSQTAAQIIDLLHKLQQNGKTVIVVTHHFPEVQQVATNVITLADGKMVEKG
jgi:putative ABC transport system ATP-binding protein